MPTCPPRAPAKGTRRSARATAGKRKTWEDFESSDRIFEDEDEDDSPYGEAAAAAAASGARRSRPRVRGGIRAEPHPSS
jgi:hypothetical protein